MRHLIIKGVTVFTVTMAEGRAGACGREGLV
jgi:hypothetical protein